MEQNTNNGNQINISGNNNQLGDIKQTMSTIPLSHSKEFTPLPKDIKDRIHNLISSNYLEDAIELLDRNTTNMQTKNLCIAVKSQLASVKQDLIAGTITVADANQRKQIITDKILKLKDMEL